MGRDHRFYSRLWEWSPGRGERSMIQKLLWAFGARNVLRWKCVPIQIPCTSYYLRLTSLWLSFLTCKNGIILIVPVLSGLVGNLCWDGEKPLLSFRGTAWRGRCHHKHKAFKLTVVVPSQLARRGGVWKWDAEMAHGFYSGTQLARTHHYENGCKMGISCVFRERKKETARIFSKDRTVSC